MSAIYIVLPLALVFVIVALIVFVRAVRSGQFDDLDTPAVRLLHDEEEPPETDRSRTDTESDPVERRDQ
jgi:cbb3-type cytochrome oxidase maturation protein